MSDVTLLKADGLLAPPEPGALQKALALSPEAIREALAAAGLVDKEDRRLADVLAEIAAIKGTPAVILPLGAEEGLFLSGLLAHCSGWLAAGLQLACVALPGAELLVYTADCDAAGPLRAALAEAAPVDGLTFLTGPASVVLREESALYTAMEGKPIRSELMEKAFPHEGWEGRPTLILDAETACWLSACVAAGLPQGKLAVAQGHTMKDEAFAPAAAPVMGQFPLGTPLADIGPDMGLTITSTRPLLLGGPSGRFTDGSAAIEYNHDFDTLRSYDESCCMADVGRALTQRAAELSCGKCVLCREGSWQLKAIFGDITAGRGKRTDAALVADVGGLIALGAFCDFGKQMVRPAMGIVEYCKPELEAHVVRKACPAGVCAGFASYVIDPKLCTGCGECLDACEFDAIEGKDGYIHMIDEDYCEKCGKCVDACEFGAARLATTKLKLPKKLTRVGAFK